MTQKKDNWRVWERMESYGDVLYKRATGEAPEMESSKALATRLKGVLRKDDRILDVGCGAGHYLRSLRKRYSFPFSYTGVDATSRYLALARKAFAQDSDAVFVKGDIEAIPFQRQSHDVVICMNVLLHLPRILPAIRELWRVTRRTLLIRTMVGEKAFRIQQVREWEKPPRTKATRDPLYTPEGDPQRFHYFNIYSKEYIQWICSTLSGVSKCRIVADRDFDPAALTAARWPDRNKPADLTKMLGGWQVNGYIVEPWSFIRLDRKA